MNIHTKNILQQVAFAATVSQLPLLLSSCTEEQMDWLTGTPINVTATMEPHAGTRTGAAQDIQTQSFDEGETLNAYYRITGGAPIGKVPTTLTASKADDNGKNTLTPNVQPYYPNSQSKTVDIYALYPPSKVNSDSESFEVEADQTTNEKYKLSDLMWASAYGEKKKTTDVNLEFAHKMAKMNITITGEEGVLIQEVRLINTVRTIAITPSTQTMGELATESDADKKKILVAKSDEAYTLGSKGGSEKLTGAVLFPPQEIKADFIEVVTNFGTTSFSTEKTFDSGTQYTASLKITREMIGFTSYIKDWTKDAGSVAVPPGSSAELKITSVASKDFTGKPIELTKDELEITFPVNDITYGLVMGKDYKCTYFNNINIGTATIIIEGLKSSERESEVAEVIKDIRAVKSFQIKSVTGSISYPNKNFEVEYEYNTTVTHKLDTIKGDGTVTFSSSVPSVAKVSERGRVTMLKEGETIISAHMTGGNYSDADAEYKLIIKPRNIKEATQRDYNGSKEIVIEPPYSEVTYNGLAYTPSVVVRDKGRILQEDTHYTLEYRDNTNASTESKKATIIVRGKGNYSDTDAAAAEVTFTINPVEPTLTLVTDAVTLPIGHTAVRLGSTNYGAVTYSGVEKASYIKGVIRGVSETGETPVTVTATVAADTEHGNWTSVSKTINVTVVQSSWTYSYTNGTVQKWECPLTGVYQLEALGAQGGTYGGFVGGRGAQIAGQAKFTKGQILYIYVGQAGAHINTASSSDSQGGWNGGGTYTGTNTSSSDQTHYCGGGGATDFALQGTEESTEWNNEAHLGSRILVAAGGGGALYRVYPGDTTFKFTGGGGGGGAYNGEAGYGGSKPGGGGTLSSFGGIASGGTQAVAAGFGYGGNYNGTLSAGMGGGGWYGGASGAFDASNENPDAKNFSRGGSGGGGSSYIWNSENATYYSGHGTNDAPTIPSGSVMTTASQFYLTPTILTEGARPGNGEARITYMGESED